MDVYWQIIVFGIIIAILEWYATPKCSVRESEGHPLLYSKSQLRMGKYTQERLDQIWDKGEIIKGKNPDLYRLDKFGNQMYKPSYGKTSEMGWNVDHSKPQAKGGTDHLNNLQPMNSRANSSKSDKY